ncbi:hypothetical protein KGF47_18295 [Clostridioides sp. ZZV13-5731]|uniref:hypothetical protein n=1 Tax=unclassified Clostridioides TaxID=2635829 RepID=UPI001D125861|nr:hypothetical protein [Clostridioides sp. ZZV15-6388]MCC0728824.1 hypothetical protein [Clostridioides sp. ZZV14-6045]MCC0752673.1 hypothetical protein [Clostridioides sp. ZZV13-5731]
MNNNKDEIKYDRKLTPREHILLYLYECNYILDQNRELKYSEFIITNDLIKKYNYDIKNNYFRTDFIKVLKENLEIIKSLLAGFDTEPWEYSKPVIWNDRKKNGYFIKNLLLSHQFEVFIDHKFLEFGVDIGLFYNEEGQYSKGECEAGIEIKYDMKSKETGNLYIEYAEKLNSHNKDWVNSGIFKNDNTRYFLIGTKELFWILRKRDLLDLYEELNQSRGVSGCRMVKAKRDTSLGFIISKEKANKMSLTFEELLGELKGVNTMC